MIAFTSDPWGKALIGCSSGGAAGADGRLVSRRTSSAA
jgi:hypothetical protein